MEPITIVLFSMLLFVFFIWFFVLPYRWERTDINEKDIEVATTSSLALIEYNKGEHTRLLRLKMDPNDIDKTKFYLMEGYNRLGYKTDTILNYDDGKNSILNYWI